MNNLSSWVKHGTTLRASDSYRSLSFKLVNQLKNCFQPEIAGLGQTLFSGHDNKFSQHQSPIIRRTGRTLKNADVIDSEDGAPVCKLLAG